MKCPLCKGTMEQIRDQIEEDHVGFHAYKCLKCGEELLDMKQLGALAKQYRQLRKAKEVHFVKWGNSLAVRIPSEVASDLGVEEGHQALLRRTKTGIEIAV